jgi:hypothetical protein
VFALTFGSNLYNVIGPHHSYSESTPVPRRGVLRHVGAPPSLPIHASALLTVLRPLPRSR